MSIKSSETYNKLMAERNRARDYVSTLAVFNGGEEFMDLPLDEQVIREKQELAAHHYLAALDRMLYNIQKAIS